MSDQEKIVIEEEIIETEETAPEESRLKKALKKVAPYTPLITTAVVVAVGGLLIFKANEELETEEDDYLATEIAVEPVETEED